MEQPSPEAEARASLRPGFPEISWDLAELRRRLERAVRSVCPPSMAADRDDLVQTTLLAVVRRFEGTAGEGSSEGIEPPSSSYLRRAAYNALVDEIRRRQRRQEVALESDHQDSDGTPGEVLLERTAAPTPGPDRHLAGSAIRQGVRSCLRELVAARRRAVTLYLMGDSVPRAAERLGWNRKRTENLVFRGLADLRRCLETKGLEP